MRPSRVLIAGLVVFLAIPAAVRSADPVEEALQQGARGLAKKAALLINLLDVLDRKTEKLGEAKLKTMGRPTLESLHLEARFKVPEVSVDAHVTNAVGGVEVPGRRVTVRLRVDCEVRCSMNLERIRIEKGKGSAPSVTVTLPDCEVLGILPKAEDADVEVHYGKLRSKKRDAKKAEALERRLLDEARDRAVERFRSESLKSYRTEVARELERQLKARFPKVAVTVKNAKP
jgi:hypothetical protein